MSSPENLPNGRSNPAEPSQQSQTNLQTPPSRTVGHPNNPIGHGITSPRTGQAGTRSTAVANVTGSQHGGTLSQAANLPALTEAATVSEAETNLKALFASVLEPQLWQLQNVADWNAPRPIFKMTIFELRREHYALGASLKASLEPAGEAAKPEIIKSLTVLKTLCTGRRDTGEDLAFALPLFADLICDLPLWAIQKAARNWAKTQKWFPTPAEFIPEIERWLDLPRAALAAFRRAKAHADQELRVEQPAKKKEIEPVAWAGKHYTEITPDEARAVAVYVKTLPKRESDDYQKYLRHHLGYPDRHALFWDTGRMDSDQNTAPLG